MRYQIDIENQPRQIHEGTAESAIEAVSRHLYISQDTKKLLANRLASGGLAMCCYGFNSAEIRVLP